MLGYLDFLFLSYSGRIGRLAYWLSYLVLGLVQIGVIVGLLWLAGGTIAKLMALGPGHHELSPVLGNELMQHIVWPTCIVFALFLWPTYAIATKRWHDRGKSGWWSLIGFVPVIGGLWAFIELGLLGGDDSDNHYGPAAY